METQLKPLRVNIIVSKVKPRDHRTAVNCLELRRGIYNYDLMKDIILAALHEQPVIIMPTFPDKIKSLNLMLENGILYMDEGKYYFYE